MKTTTLAANRNRKRYIIVEAIAKICFLSFILSLLLFGTLLIKYFIYCLELDSIFEISCNSLRGMTTRMNQDVESIQKSLRAVKLNFLYLTPFWIFNILSFKYWTDDKSFRRVKVKIKNWIRK